MNQPIRGLAVLALLASALSSGCATQGQGGYDYTAFRASRPKSILILPPVNNTNEVGASNSLLSTMTLPLGESGYYVYPVSLVNETFKQNGLTQPAEIAAVPIAKLRQIFGADAGLYVQIKRYGTSYVVISSASVVTAEAKLVDLRSGTVLWQGSASASSSESGNNAASSGSLIGLLVVAVVNQIVEQSTDASHDVAGLTSARLLMAGQPNGLLYGPRSPKYSSQ